MIEDFHTEIVAQVLRNSPALTLDWLRRVGATTLEKVDCVTIATQETYEKLDGHATDSRPDITIRLMAGGATELIFVESKLPSTQGSDQLQRYVEHLNAATTKQSVQKTSLVFITRDYEAASGTLMIDPRFKLARWFEFYQILKSHVNGDGLAKELMLFMKDNHMSVGNQFRAIDLVALENFLSVKALMDETLDGEVAEEAKRILGGITSIKKASNQLRDQGRYIISSLNWNDLCPMIGYWLPRDEPDEPVWLGITIESNPSSAMKADIRKAFQGWLAGAGHEWKADGLDDEMAWGSIYKGRFIQSFLGGTDHVHDVKRYLLSLLSEVEAFRTAYPKLPWSGCSSAESAIDVDGE